MSVPSLLARVVPTCFVVGAAVELFMIKVDINGTNFYGTARRKAAEKRDAELLARVEYLEHKRAAAAEVEARRKAALAYIRQEEDGAGAATAAAAAAAAAAAGPRAPHDS